MSLPLDSLLRAVEGGRDKEIRGGSGEGGKKTEKEEGKEERETKRKE